MNENVVNHYNAMNQLISTLTKNYKVSFTYDAEGLRTSKTVNGEKTVFVWDGDQVVMELSESGKVKKRYVSGNDLVFVDKGEGTKKQYYVTDPHGNVAQLTDDNGKVTKTYEYDTFGNEVNPDQKDENPFRYCGEYYDKETGEVYLRARYYQPGVGRFLTRDTYTGESDDPESLHLYTYCGNDGVNYIDPSGHWGKFSSTENSDVPYYRFVHQQLTAEALMQLSFSNSKFTFTSLDFCRGTGLSKKELGYILDGSILPDYLKKKPNKKNKWNTKGKIIANIRTKKKILGMNLKDENTFHGKNKKKLENLKDDAEERFKKKGSKKEKLILLGCVLHSIQDYQAHSFKGDLEIVKKNFEKGNYAYLPEVLVYNKDWLQYYLSIQGARQEGKIEVNDSKYIKKIKETKRKEHHNFKDNPYMDFVKCKNMELWMWAEVSSPSSNGRYIQARKDSVGYLNKALKQISRWG